MRTVLLLLAALACTPANASPLKPPGRPMVTVVAAGDTATLVVTWSAMRGATGYLGSVKDSASNGTWTGEPVRQVVSSQWTLFVISSTADSAYFRVTLWSTQSGRVSADSGMSAWVLWRRTLHAPTPTVNVSVLVFPNPATMTLGSTRDFCAFLGLSDGAVTEWTLDRSRCDPIYVANVPLAARNAVTPADQAHTDSLGNTCVGWSWDKTYLSAVQALPCSPALAVTAILVTGLRGEMQIRPAVSFGEYMAGPVVKVDRTGKVTCLHAGEADVYPIVSNPVPAERLEHAHIVCAARPPVFLAGR